MFIREGGAGAFLDPTRKQIIQKILVLLSILISLDRNKSYFNRLSCLIWTYKVRQCAISAGGQKGGRGNGGNRE